MFDTISLKMSLEPELTPKCDGRMEGWKTDMINSICHGYLWWGIIKMS
jgi:hypothetical protein